MANLKNITDLPIIGSADGVNLIVNDNGSAKQIAAGAVGAQADFNVTDESHPAFIKNKPAVAQSDWSIEDENNPAFIKNKTHWAKVVSEGVLPLTTLQEEDYNQDMRCFLINDIKLVSGGEYVVNWNGKEYTCISSTIIEGGIEGVVLGNTGVIDGSGDNGLPFIMMYVEEIYGNAVAIQPLDSSVPTIVISCTFEEIHKLDNKYLNTSEIIKNSNIENGSAIGSIRTTWAAFESEEYTIGEYAFAAGQNTTASGNRSHAEGWYTTASGNNSHAEGFDTTASGEYSHAEGYETTASGFVSHAEGIHTTASGKYQHVQGKYNIEDTSDTYAHIVGNGEYNAPSNAHTLDWSGNAWFAGTVEATGIIIASPNGTRYKLTVSDDGTLSATPVV